MNGKYSKYQLQVKLLEWKDLFYIEYMRTYLTIIVKKNLEYQEWATFFQSTLK